MPKWLRERVGADPHPAPTASRTLARVEARPLNAGERAVLEFLLSRDFPGRRELAVQAESVRTSGRSCPCGVCPTFSLIANRSVPPAPVLGRLVEEAAAHGTDPTGNLVYVDLYVHDGYLAEVEVGSYMGYDVKSLPSPDWLKHSEWSEPDEYGGRTLLNG